MQIGDQTPFPPKEGQKVHREGALLDTKDGKGNGTPSAQKDEDILAFDKYAEVLVERLRDPDMWPVSLGIYAQWGAGKVRNQEFYSVYFFVLSCHFCTINSARGSCAVSTSEVARSRTHDLTW